jgi:6-phosphogluconolactonase
VTTRGELLVFPDPRAASRAAAESFVELAAAAAAASRTFSVALTGGSSPGELFRQLASDDLRPRVPWHAVHLFWGDERCVPPAHPRSNYGMANRLLLSRVPIPPENVHRMRGEIPAIEGAELYRRELERFFGAPFPRFDLVHLGMGPDGHVCSLFPFSPVLLERRASTGVSLLRSEGEWRVTLTYPAVNAAKRVEFLVFGAGKRKRVRQVLSGALDPLRIPAQGVRPSEGEMVWWVDEAAA